MMDEVKDARGVTILVGDTIYYPSSRSNVIRINKRVVLDIHFDGSISVEGHPDDCYRTRKGIIYYPERCFVEVDDRQPCDDS